MPRMPLTTIGRLLLLAAVPALLSLTAIGSVSAQTFGDECTNPEIGYTVAYPTGWYVNAHVEGGELDDVAACRFFSPDDFEVQPQAGIAGVAIAMSTESTVPEGGTPTTVDNHAAFITEPEAAEDGFEPAGTRHYDYWVELGRDAWLRAGTSDADTSVGAYDENKAVLDAMMDTLEFAGSHLPDTALPLAGDR